MPVIIEDHPIHVLTYALHRPDQRRSRTIEQQTQQAVEQFNQQFEVVGPALQGVTRMPAVLPPCQTCDQPTELATPVLINGTDLCPPPLPRRFDLHELHTETIRRPTKRQPG